ncbi:hypothetical protein K2224_31250 (plasmid) [Streptomyces sp. BHT-5-2]|uniref:hypothetical protein n=1 Tax=unclassified Streptomyces TaxID=2593676 RepID=UPI001C8D7B9E|nr:hypothetical protein [Streptomyces sp. BHT-5-2]QZL07714.1 hypothetical protein K2224_31250 [Streptomyces sp. BHT-5-2]
MTLRKPTVGASLLTAAGLLVGAAPTVTAAPAKYTHAAAALQFRKAGVAWTSSGRCSDRNNRTCTSFDRINRSTVAGVIAFKRASRCAVTVTAGTEKGHRSSRYSHWNGYKVDVRVTPCVDGYIAGHFRYAGRRPGDQAKTYKSPAGNVYAREVSRRGTHWDIVYFNGNR